LDRDKGLRECVSERNAEREFKVQLNEAMERHKRRTNLVIMGAVEDTVDQTKELIGSMLKVLLQDDVEFTVLGRVGKLDGAKIRPVRICIEDADIRRKLLKKASSLKNNKEYEKIYVSPDLTTKQQEEDKKL